MKQLPRESDVGLASYADAALVVRQLREAHAVAGDVSASVHGNLNANQNVAELGGGVAVERDFLMYHGKPILSFKALPAFLRITEDDHVRRVQQCAALVQYYVGRACQCLVDLANAGADASTVAFNTDLERTIADDLRHALSPSDPEAPSELERFADELNGRIVGTLSFSVVRNGGPELVCRESSSDASESSGTRDLRLRLDAYDDRYWRIIAAVFKFWSVGFGMQEAARRGVGPAVLRSPETAEIDSDALYLLLFGFVKRDNPEPEVKVEQPLELAIASVVTAVVRRLPVASFLPSVGSSLSIASALPVARHPLAVASVIGYPPLHLAVATILAASPPVAGAIASVLPSAPRPGAIASVLPSAPKPGAVASVIPALPPRPGVVASVLASAPVSLEVALVLPKDKTVVEAVVSLIPPTKPYVFRYFNDELNYYDLDRRAQMKMYRDKSRTRNITFYLLDKDTPEEITIETADPWATMIETDHAYVFKLRLGPKLSNGLYSSLTLNKFNWVPPNITLTDDHWKQIDWTTIDWTSTGSCDPVKTYIVYTYEQTNHDKCAMTKELSLRYIQPPKQSDMLTVKCSQLKQLTLGPNASPSIKVQIRTKFNTMKKLTCPPMLSMPRVPASTVGVPSTSAAAKIGSKVDKSARGGPANRRV